MNSIKNAIVTVTLLAVGYGSYIVLSEPQPGMQPDVSRVDMAPNPSDTTDTTDPTLEIEDSTTSPPGMIPAPQSTHLSDELTNSEVKTDDSSDSQSDVSRAPSLNAPSVQTAIPPESIIPAPITEGENLADATPNVQLAPPSSGNINAPAKPDFPELMPLPEMTTTTGGFDLQPPVDSSRRENPVLTEQPPLPDIPSGPDADVTPQVEPPATNHAPNPPSDELTAVGVRPPVGHQESSSVPSVNAPGALQDGSTPGTVTTYNGSQMSPAGPELIDVQPTQPQPTPSAITPPIDPSVGPIPPAPSEGSMGFEKTWSEVQEFIRVKDLPKALQALSPWATDATLNQEQQQRCFHMLDELAGGVVYSRTSYLEPAYVVRAGETLEEIAAAHGVPLELLAKINGISAPYALSTGESLKVVRGPFRAVVSVSQRQLTLFAGTHYAGRFRIEVGPDLPTEEAYYEVGEKSPGRSYFDRRTGAEVLQSSENNRYGDHWLGLRGEHITTGHSVGIHGRAKKKAPNDLGCISLDAIDADDLYSILSVGSQIHVRQ